MSINIGPPSVEELRPRITVIGVGGAGGNAIANMIEAEIEGVDFIIANTDAQALNNAVAEHRIQLGPDITQGLGAGSRPEVGRAAAEETVEEIERALDGVNMVFIAAGMGGGTGTGAAPVIAEVARRKGILTVGVVTKPFLFEGTRRMRAAEAGIEELQKHVDTLIVIPNQNLFLVAKADTTFKEAFVMADEVLQQGVRSITDLIVNPGMINLDFADIRSVMNEMGKAMMGTGEAEGPNRALEAAERAIANPLLDGVSMQGAKGVIISIIGGDDMKLLEVDEAANHIRELVDSEANIIWGTAFNPDLAGKIRVSVVATGIEQSADHQIPPHQPVNLGAARGPKAPGSMSGMAAPGAIGGVAGAAPSAFAQEPEPVAPAPVTDELLDLADSLEQEDAGGDLPDPADDSEFGRSSEDGFASLTGLRSSHEDDDDDALDLSGAAELAPARPAVSAVQDELTLDAGRLAQADGEGTGGLRRRRLFGASDVADEAGDPVAAPAPAPAPAPTGSTLFERMANIAPPALESDRAEEDDDSESGSAGFRIPRFLNRTNNQ
ncbi:cell division protein FtsZ [Alteraurantiacibacter palmitatis]|uniref:Cell division protein FtsZ n=1 Tax=Alteraurantiacibacter palmitatis TaxID=2054628 RepID=A0ABV7E9H4_9SPHN